MATVDAAAPDPLPHSLEQQDDKAAGAGSNATTPGGDVVANWIVAATAVIVISCLLIAFSLCRQVIDGAYLQDATEHELIVRMLLSCIGCFVSLAFAALGFGLFLLKAKGSFSGSSDNPGAKLTIQSTAPGLVVIVCATIVFGMSITIRFSDSTTTTTTGSVSRVHSPSTIGPSTPSVAAGTGSGPNVMKAPMP